MYSVLFNSTFQKAVMSSQHNEGSNLRIPLLKSYPKEICTETSLNTAYLVMFFHFHK